MRDLRLTVLNGQDGLPLKRCWRCDGFLVLVQASPDLTAVAGVAEAGEYCLGSKLCMLGILGVLRKLEGSVR